MHLHTLHIVIHKLCLSMFFSWNHSCQRCWNGTDVSNYSHYFLEIITQLYSLYWLNIKPVLCFVQWVH